MEVTGVAQLFASVFVKLSKAIGGQTAPLISIYMTAGLLTEILTNNATAALVYPIAARLGDSLGVSPQLMAIAVMLGSSDAFISPFGYQCNLMSMSAGGYTTMQFIKYGIPLQIIQFAGTSAIFAARGHKWLFALATTALGAAVVLVPLAFVHLPASWRRVLTPRVKRGPAKSVDDAGLVKEAAVAGGKAV
jgi:hypothetical protein